MSNRGEKYNLNQQIYENSDKSIKIYKTRKYASIKYIAVKVYEKRRLKNKYSYEYDTINNIKNEGIINILSSSEDYNYYYMEMEYCATGDLSHCLWQNKNNSYLERTIKTIGCQLLSGLQALHKSGIIHCNLKPSNIVIDEYGNVKICDFKKCLKISKMTKELIEKNKCAMTPCYTAPELFRKEGKYSFKSDLWALGCILYELAVGQVPFFDNSIDKLIKKIIQNEVNFDRKELTNYSMDFIDVIKKLLIKEPNSRVTWGEIERMAWWDGYFYSGNEINQKTDNNSDLSKMNTTNYTNNDKNIDAEKLSKIAVRNRREQKEDYNSAKDDKIASTEDEFDFQSNDIEDLDENNLKNPQFISQLPQSKFPMNISVLSISKAFKRDRRTYDAINSELIKSSEEELPKLANFILHQTDRIIKPIIGNKIIEENQVSTYNRTALPFTPWRKDTLKEMMANNTDLKNVENYLYNIYTSLEENAQKKDYEKLIYLLKYFETLAFDRDIANNLINTSFIQIFIEFLQEIKNEQVLVKCCCIIGYMIRYATIISAPLDKYGFDDIICKIIKESKDNSDLIKKATATLGEYLFYVGTQEEAPDNNEWRINKKYLDILLFCLDKNRNDIVKFYAIKTIENLCILTNVSKGYFAKKEYLDKILQIYLSSNNSELKYSAISTISHMLRHNSSLIQIFFKNIQILTNRNILIAENENIRQCLINCILFPISIDHKIIINIISQDNILMEILLYLSEKSNNVIKIKIIVLIGLIMINPNIIIQYGEKTFTKMQRWRNDKNKDIHIAVKFFEKSLCNNSPIFIQAFLKALNKNDKMADIYKYCETFDIIGIYHKVSYTLFTPQLLYTIKDYIIKKVNSGNKDDNLIGALLDVFIKFSENPLSVDQNVDVILRGTLIDIIKICQKVKGDNSSKIIIITANILTIILSNDRLYSIDGKEGIRNNEIRAFIKKLIPLFGNLIKDNDLTEEILSLLSLIVERDENYIQLYSSSGVIDYLFDIMMKKEFSNNLNIIKILIILMESNNIGFKEIIDMNFIDKINFLIDRAIKNNNIYNNDEESSYLDYVFELFYAMIMKIFEYKTKKFPKNLKIDVDDYTKNYSSKVEAIGKNFNLCIKLLGNQKNVSLQQIGCVCLIFILQTFPGVKIESLNLELKFKGSDIPNLLKGLELSCNKIHKKMIHIFQWILQFQKDANKILKPYLSYLITYLENICNTSADPDVIRVAQQFLDNEIKKLK
jgi:serine/threonine-protein kinase ULK4